MKSIFYFISHKSLKWVPRKIHINSTIIMFSIFFWTDQGLTQTNKQLQYCYNVLYFLFEQIRDRSRQTNSYSTVSLSRETAIFYITANGHAIHGYRYLISNLQDKFDTSWWYIFVNLISNMGPRRYWYLILTYAIKWTSLIPTDGKYRLIWYHMLDLVDVDFWY